MRDTITIVRTKVAVPRIKVAFVKYKVTFFTFITSQVTITGNNHSYGKRMELYEIKYEIFGIERNNFANENWSKVQGKIQLEKEKKIQLCEIKLHLWDIKYFL